MCGKRCVHCSVVPGVKQCTGKRNMQRTSHSWHLLAVDGQAHHAVIAFCSGQIPLVSQLPLPLLQQCGLLLDLLLCSQIRWAGEEIICGREQTESGAAEPPPKACLQCAVAPWPNSRPRP